MATAKRKAVSGAGAKTAPATRHVALLRGINVAGKNLIPMPRLAAAFEAAGGSRVETFIQSGNVVFDGSASVMNSLAARVSRQLGAEFDYRVPIVLRSALELQAVVRDNPFLAAGADVATLHVMFLSDAPARERAAGLDPERSPGDRWQLRGRELYLCLPNGVGRSKLSNAYFDSKLGVTSTGRNWRTVLKLAELALG
jgi:uncharacterized protein (DUF1697 family)